jgi:hypothetical protein
MMWTPQASETSTDIFVLKVLGHFRPKQLLRVQYTDFMPHLHHY